MPAAAATAYLTTATSAHLESRVDARVNRLAYASMALLVLVAPFEATRPLLTLPSQSLSSVEAALLLALAIAAVPCAQTLRSRSLAGTLATPWGAVGLAAAIATLTAPGERANAAHMTARMMLAGALYVATLGVVDSWRRMRGLVWLLAVAGAAVAALAILEYANVAPVLGALTAFRPSAALVGAQVRAAGPLQYPTIASMLMEISFACALGLLMSAGLEARRRSTFALVALLALIGEGIVVTFTRSGLITAGISLGLFAVVAWRRWPRRTLIPLAVVALIGVAEVWASRSNEIIAARMTSEGQNGWYGAQFTVPSSIELRPGEVRRVPVQVTNTGLVTWTSDAPHPFRLSYHWLEGNSARVVEWEGARTLLSAPVPPGKTAALDATVVGPPTAGSYRLVWDIEQTKTLWFSTEPDAVLVATSAVVAGPPVGARRSSHLYLMPTRAVRPGRGVLWSAAASMWRAHPWTGVGPDNFRLLYGRYAGLDRADPRVHSNNMYLELAVGTGVIGALALGWFGWRLVLIARVVARRAEPLTLGLLAATLAIVVHGMADSFLSFTPTYVVMAITLALLTVAARSGDMHAHRV